MTCIGLEGHQGQLALEVEDTGASRMFPSQPLTERPSECLPRDGLVEMAQVGTEKALKVAIELVRGCLKIDPMDGSG